MPSLIGLRVALIPIRAIPNSAGATAARGSSPPPARGLGLTRAIFEQDKRYLSHIEIGREAQRLVGPFWPGPCSGFSENLKD